MSHSTEQRQPGAKPLRNRRHLKRWLLGVGIALATILVILPWLWDVSPLLIDPDRSLQPPSSQALLGTDQTGRDLAARILHGSRISLAVGFGAAMFALVVGSIIGAAAVVGPTWLGEVLMRIMDIGLAFPGILLAIVLAAAIGPSLPTTIVVLGTAYTPSMARVVRSAVFTEYGEDYVTAARLIGTRKIRLVTRHIGVNAALPICVYTTLVMADAIVAEAALSFLGAGIPPPAPSWGNIIREGQTIVHAGAWWVSLFPGIALVITVIVLNKFSEVLGRDLGAR